MRSLTAERRPALSLAHQSTSCETHCCQLLADVRQTLIQRIHIFSDNPRLYQCEVSYLGDINLIQGSLLSIVSAGFINSTHPSLCGIDRDVNRFTPNSSREMSLYNGVIQRVEIIWSDDKPISMNQLAGSVARLPRRRRESVAKTQCMACLILSQCNL